MHKEADFEATIERSLLEQGGYAKLDAKGFDRERALWADELIAFIQDTQPALWEAFSKQHGESLRGALVDQVIKDLNKRGTLDVLRHGFKFYGRKFEAAFFRPAHGLNPDLEAQYRQNRLTVSRQVYFDAASEKSIDMVLALNGLPIATLELKNPLAGQDANHAVRQYRHDRDPRLPLLQFKKRALVHFAVDPDQVYMATRLSGKQTFFLPFNQGSAGAGHAGGAGNPAPRDGGYRTQYLWREVLQRDSLLDVLARFIHLVREEKREGGKAVTKETLIFPRYHQLDVVRRLVATTAHDGPGEHYLVQHSAGSGKSNSIAWLAHRLSSLHDTVDSKVFDSVVVITDRRVLDKQLQDTIYQFEHKQGVVARIDQNSAQLGDELMKGTPIVITTLQKFPFVADQVGKLPDRNYAVIVDEAHSSQGGEAAQDLKKLLGQGRVAEEPASIAADGSAEYGADNATDPEGPTYEDAIAATLQAKGKQKNLSFFAFTATPKAKTLELFGHPGPDGRPLPFHVYGMRQAIEEGFILDVLKNYATYKTYYRLVNATEDDPVVKKKEARAALARFVSLHPHNIAQKTEVMIEHFRQHTRRKINGRAKAMVVTRSRLHAVRYKQAFDSYIRDRGYEADLRALVAFSGTVTDDGQDFTEVGMNQGIQEKELPEKFATDEYQVLLVANKYQTGFDQPLLHTMYVDRKLSGVQAVQTLSRLNRMCPGKEDTFVLDFANEPGEVQAAFQPFYEVTSVAEQADTQQLYDLQHDLDDAQVYTDSEVEAFARVFYKPKQNLSGREHENLYRHLNPSLDRYKAWEDEEARDKWRTQLQAFVRLYAFLSQVMPFTDADLEKRYSFARFLLKRLPRERSERFELDGEAELEYYRLTRIGETDIPLASGEVGEVKGPTAVGTGQKTDEEVQLSTIIDKLNELFGTEFNDEDRLFLDHIVQAGVRDGTVQQRAEANTYENFAISIQGLVQNLVIDGLDRHDQLATKYLDEGDFKRVVFEHVAKRMYDELQKKTG